MRKLAILISLLVFVACEQSDKPENVSEEKHSTLWRGQLILSEDGQLKLPFLFRFDPSEVNLTFTIINGPEHIELPHVKLNGDSVTVKLDPYNSQLEFLIEGKDLKGVWRNFAKGPDYVVPFIARNGSVHRFIDSRFSDVRIEGNYKIEFGDTVDGFPGLGEFTQEEEEVLGTIRTETGDYRYLAGRQAGDELFLSCFDGAHAFLFQAKIDSSLNLYDGHFYSGSHYHINWTGTRSDSFKLADPDSITYSLEDSARFNFSIPLEDGSALTLDDPIFESKVSLIQIMGTWCPNCKDESEYLKGIYDQYGSDKLNIMAVCFENERDPKKSRVRMLAYKTLLNLPYDMHYGGPSRKDSVINVFPTLNRVASFPTLIVLNKEREVVKIHAGFNGPATSGYEPFVSEMNVLLDSLVNESRP